MDISDFTASLAQAEPPAGLSLALEGLWWEAKGDWQRAHRCAQEDRTASGSSVHAYLHRVDGDLSNAGYWYRRAKRPPATGPLREEWETLARELLAQSKRR
jgi:hypothetical protein